MTNYGKRNSILRKLLINLFNHFNKGVALLSNHGKQYSDLEKLFIALVALLLVQSRQHMETVVAPQIAQILGRTDCAICKQIELALGFHFRKNF